MRAGRRASRAEQRLVDPEEVPGGSDRSKQKDPTRERLKTRSSNRGEKKGKKAPFRFEEVRESRSGAGEVGR